MRFTLRGASAPQATSTESAGAVSAASKRSLALCFAPLALLGIAAAGSAVARHAPAGKPPVVGAPVPESALNRTPVGTRTCRAANAFLQRVLGNQTKVASATVLGDHSLHSTARAGAWSVLCDTSEGRYLMLINEKTRQVYAVNHVEETRFDMELRQSDETAGSEGDEGAALETVALMSRDTAKGQALHYLSLIGMSTQNLTTLPDEGAVETRHGNPYGKSGKPSDERTYNFAFTDSRHPTQPIMVAVNGRSGKLQSLWRAPQNI